MAVVCGGPAAVLPPETDSGLSGQSTARSRLTRLPPKVLEELRANGLCFRCKKPFTPGHDCPFKQLWVMVAKEDEELDLQQYEYCEVTGLEVVQEAQGGSNGEEGDFPVYSMAGIFCPRTMRIQGVVEGCTVTTLIDSGASHNFISSSLVSMLRLNPKKTSRFGVQLGDGHRQESKGVCRQLPISLPGCAITEDCYVFALGGVDIILEVAWLATMGEVRTNWEMLTMNFEWGDGRVELKGDPVMCRNLVSLRTLIKIIEIEFWTVLDSEPAKLSNATVGEWGDILEYHAEVFKEPQGQPPCRATDHRIELTSGSKPLSVRPYRYGHLQKDEIERLVDEMLRAGAIRPSSSPVLLVKKKDGS